MTTSIEVSDLDRFRHAICRRFGLYFDDTKLPYLASVLDRRVTASGAAKDLYLDRIEGRASLRDERELAQELTVGETYFFRHMEQFRAFAEVALPARLAARAGDRRLRLLSAGCASGDEPYSLAILLRERALEPGWDIAVYGVDLNAVMLERAARTRYSAWSLRETPGDIQRRWFVADGREFILDPTIRAAVTLEERNLTLDDASFWGAERFDVVFCRNVMMYFSPDIAQQLVARIATALAPGGYLFLGHAETLRGLSQDFHLCHTHGTFYYQRKDSVGHSTSEAVPTWDENRGNTVPLVDTGWTATWIETVGRATDRIKALSEEPPEPAAVRSGIERGVGLDLGVAIELLRRERFGEALELLGNLPPRSARDPDVILLRAVLLTHSGELDQARKVCAELVLLDELSSGAHYLLALCAEGMRECQKAAEEDQIAIYLDSGFAMPHLHLGLMARRSGDGQTAQRELAQAALLLGMEDASRLLLFGGGFSRDSLVALCKAELGRLGGRP